MGALTSCEKCVGPTQPDEKLRRESTNILASHPPRRPDVDAIASPVLVTLGDLLLRMEEAHEEHLKRSQKILRELRTTREAEASASVIDLEEARLEEEHRRRMAWGNELLISIRTPPPKSEESVPEERVQVIEPEPPRSEIEEVTPVSVPVDALNVKMTPRRRVSTTAPKPLAQFMKLPPVRWTLYTCLALALFLPGSVTLLNLPDQPTVVVQDVLMSFIALAFMLEMLGLLMVEELYRYSFFFLMDLLGTISMAFEISFLLGQYLNSNTVVLRTARTAKLGARIGRLIKLVKCVSMFYRSSGRKGGEIEAKVLASKLVVLLSTRVSVIVILMVMVVPLSTLPLHPTEDLSLSLWPKQLEESYFQDQLNSTQNLQATINQMVQFYQGVSYWPYLVRGYGSELTLSSTPLRARNSLVASVDPCLVQRAGPCDAAVLFDFTGPQQLDALVEVCTIAFIIGLMALTSCDLQQVVDANLVKPLEGMLQHLRENAAYIFDRLSRQTQAETLDEEEQEETSASEIELIQRILEKLSRLASLAEVSMKAVTQNELENMNVERKAVLLDMLNVQVVAAPIVSLGQKRSTKLDTEAEWTQSWDLNFLEAAEHEIHDYVHYMFFSSQFGVAYHFTTDEAFQQFLHNVQANYKDVPYHKFQHGVDALFTVFRLLQLSAAGKWTSDIEQYALLVAALCHDLGHFGRTNQFLVETKHELALRYNDSSPLENMHCAMLFQLCQHANQDVFAHASPEQQKEARKIAIAVILHTDNVHHFDMVKDVSAVYEMESEICDVQATTEVVTASYREKVLLGKNKMMWLQLFLHFADVSNPLKPFEICRAWAWGVLDEFFGQGDEEKSLGIPVGMLNDRDKVNRPGSQHGFINFLVAPFVAASVRIFPGLQPMHAQMISNLEEWRELWIEETKPSPEDIAKKDADVEKLRALDAELRGRVKRLSVAQGSRV